MTYGSLNYELWYSTICTDSESLNVDILLLYWSTRPTHTLGMLWSLFLHVVSVRQSPIFKISQNKTKFQLRLVIASSGTVGLAERVMDETHTYIVILYTFPILHLGWSDLRDAKPNFLRSLSLRKWRGHHMWGQQQCDRGQGWRASKILH